MNRTTNFNRLNDNGQNEMRIANPAIKQRRIANPSQRMQRTPLLRQLIVLAVMLTGMAGIAKAQSVIVNGNYYLKHGTDGHSVQTAASTGFDPSTCLWYVSGSTIKTADANGEAFSGNYFLQTESVSLGNSVNWYTAPSNGNNLRATNNNYLRRSGSSGEWQINTYNNRATLYNVTITPATLSATISGNAILTTTGNYNYTASGSFTNANYRFNGTDHYYPAGGTTTVTPSVTWSIAGDGSSYVTLYSSTGTITVNSIPAGEDKTIILTCNASHNGVDASPATKTITLQGTIPSAPIISVSGTTVTMATDAVGTTTIRYTLDGSDPTTSSTAYSEPIDVSGQTTSPVVIKAITVRNGNASSVTEQSVQLALPTPVITADASTGTATITCANAGATIYYTTDGTTPSATNGTAFTGQISGLSLMTTLQAIAVRDGWNDSPVASTTLALSSGTNTDTVTLFDLEDHNWRYYQAAGGLPTGYPDPIHSPDPRNVTITYQGNGQTIGTATVSGVKVSIAANETQNTFVYYKTLEKGTDSKYAYKTIANPFSVRPKIGDTYYGFDGWEVVSVDGGSIDGYAVGSTISANTEIKFVPTRAYTTNSMSMEVVLRAKWAVAEVSTNGTFTNDYGVERMFYVRTTSANNNAFTANNKAITYTSIYPNGTYDGTNAASTSNIKYRPFGSENAFTLAADSRIENIQIYNGNNLTINANNHNLTVGRNVSGYNGGNTAATVKGHADGGGQGSPYSAAMNYTICLESGTYGEFYLIDNYSSLHYYSGRISLKGVLGSDYDRAKHDDSKLHVAPNGSISAAERVAMTDNANKDQLAFDWNVKSGKLQETLLGNASAEKSLYMAPGSSTQYVGKRKLLVEGGELASIAGGIESYANLNTNGYTTADTYVSDDLTDQVYIRITNNDYTKVRGAIYGAAAFAGSRGGRTFVITGGTINGWIAGGCNGTQSSGGQLYGTTYMYIGGNAKVVHANDDPYIGEYNLTHGSGWQTVRDGDNGAYGGNIFGAGCGIKPYNYNAANPGATLNEATVGKVYGSNIALADNLVVSRDVYGGGNFGQVADNSGDWSSNNDMTSDLYVLGANIKGNVYGGSNNQQGQTVNITMTDGTVESSIYGGSNTWGTINNDVTIQVDGGTVGQGNAGNGIFGGGYGNATRVLGSVNLTLGSGCNATEGVTVYGDVYGGSAEGRTNGDNDHNGNTTTTVNMYKGTINGSLYGGGLGTASNAAHVYGPVQVNVIGGSIRPTDGTGENGSGGVYGCNNTNGAPQSTVKVDIYGTDTTASGYALYAVYGGGNQSDYNGVPEVTIHGCNNKIEYVYGGGNASDVRGTNVVIWGGTIGNAFGGGNGFGDSNPGANITNNGTQLYIHGGTIHSAFGGSNQKGYINSTIKVEVDNTPETGSDPFCNEPYGDCGASIVELYGGGNEAAAIKDDNTYIQPDLQVKSCDVEINNLFGGAKKANHNANINLTVEGGIYQNVFGGNNISGIIGGDITLTIKGGTMVNAFGGNNEGGDVRGKISVIMEADGGCPLNVDNVYGGGNMAPYTPTTNTARPEVTIKNGTVNNAVFGGGLGSGATVTASPTVTVGDNTTGYKATVGGTKIDSTPGDGNVFGGGNAAKVFGNTEVKILYNTDIKGNVYGGGNAASVSGNTKVNIGN